MLGLPGFRFVSVAEVGGAVQLQLHGRERPGCGYSGSGGARPRCHPGNLVETSFVEKAFHESRASPPGIQY